MVKTLNLLIKLFAPKSIWDDTDLQQAVRLKTYDREDTKVEYSVILASRREKSICG